MQQKNNSNLTEFNKFDTDIHGLDGFLNYNIFHIGNFTLTPGMIMLIIIVLGFTWVSIRVIKRVIVGKRSEENIEFGRRFSVYMIVKYILYVMAFVLVLEVVGIGVNALLVGSAALLVGIGMGLQNIFSDLVSGLFLLFERPIELGDVIEVDNIVGKIQVIKLRHTVVLDRDGVNLIVPNHKFVTEKVINWSHQKEERRFRVKVGVDYTSNPQEVASILKNVARTNSFVIKDSPAFPIMVRFADFGDSALVFELFFWTRHSFIVENIMSDMRFQIFDEFGKAGVQIPFPQHDLHIKSKEF
jgi:small-conductance mechanosensitive channel